MRILHLSTNDIGGGAARAAHRLHSGLRRAGIDSTMLVANRQGDDPSVRMLPAAAGLTHLRQRLRGRLIGAQFKPYRATRPKGLEPFSDDRSRYGADLVAALPPCDVVTLHWVAGMLDYQQFFRTVPRHTPVVWRLSDMNAFTGGCHYDEECGRYLAACGACPQLGSRRANDLSHQIWRRKRAAFDQVPPGRLHIVALNTWIADEVRRSALLSGVPVSRIPNGLDTTIFAPQDKADARAALGLPQDAKVVLFVAASVGNRRKGFALLAEALAGMADLPGLHLISLGRGAGAIDGRIPHRNLGSLSDDRLIAQVYNAADLFVIPSLQDNMPSTALESIACGTPVVGFDVGGVAEMVRPGLTGLLAPKADVAGLRAAMLALLGDKPRRQAMGERCRQIALSEYRQELQAERYIALYRSLVPHTAP